MEGYFERVVETLTGAGYRWYETANFCRPASGAGGRDLRAQHNLAYWRGRDYLGLGIGAVSTVGGHALAEHAELGALPRRAGGGAAARRARSRSSTRTRADASGCCSGLRLDEPLPLAGARRRRVDAAALERARAARARGARADATARRRWR